MRISFNGLPPVLRVVGPTPVATVREVNFSAEATYTELVGERCARCGGIHWSAVPRGWGTVVTEVIEAILRGVAIREGVEGMFNPPPRLVRRDQP